MSKKTDMLRRAMQVMGRKGGKAAAKRMTAAQLTERAHKASHAAAVQRTLAARERHERKILAEAAAIERVAEQAKKVFENEKAEAAAAGLPSPPDSFILNDYVSHYDPRVNVCYMMTHYVSRHASELVLESFDVTDAFERQQYATYRWADNKLESCYVFAIGHPTKCKTQTQFLILVDKYFGIRF
jgi:hypothetical protein